MGNQDDATFIDHRGNRICHHSPLFLTLVDGSATIDIELQSATVATVNSKSQAQDCGLSRVAHAEYGSIRNGDHVLGPRVRYLCVNLRGSKRILIKRNHSAYQ